MRLYILRHAIAGTPDPEKYPDDAERPLTRAGSKKMVKIARALYKMGVQPDLILSSRLVRARETADIARKGLGLKKDRLILIEQLAPAGDPGQLIAEIQSKYVLESLMLVGHEPDLSSLVSLLLSGDPSLPITLKKGGACCLSVDQLTAGKCATLEWLINPGQLLSGS
ncbi:MAG: phosphohistidine phosphatase SixA [Bacteroidota bacterium]